MKKAKIGLYALALVEAIVALVLFFLYTIHGKMSVGEGGEALGWILAASMTPLLALFILRCIFLSKKTKPETKMKLAPVYAVANQLHMPIGAMSIGFLLIHFAMVFDVNDPSYVHFVTGYVLIGLLLALASIGIIAHTNKTPARKYLTLCHQIDVALLLITFVIHLILK
jgi:hypothetical protein